MKRNVLPTTVSFFVLMICMAFTSSPNSDNNIEKCNSTDTTLELNSPQERISFMLESTGWNEVILCNLEPGETYNLTISEVGDACPKPLVFVGNALPQLKIKPTAECFYLNIHNFCDSQKEAILSVSLQTKENIQSNNNSNPQNGPEMVPITTNTGLTATELIEDVFIGGGCFDVTNVQTIGNGTGIGSFANGLASLGFDDGVVLSTGFPASVSGPNSGEAGASNAIGGGSDADLALLTAQAINDASGIEFDFSPTVSAVQFRFVFGSEEYCEWVNSAFNDVFGFFISGPGINGPFSNNGVNIALVPNTLDPITINSVNHLANTAYFNPNNAGCLGTTNTADIEFDGYTTVLTATADLIPCETYHIRLVIGDGTDAIYDSAVFLEAGSFNAGGQATVSSGGNVSGSNIIYEGCGDGFVTFTRQTGDINIPLTITYNILPTSTATSGVDYTPIPLTITIPAGQTEVTIPITAFNDGIPEGIETIILEIDNSCSCINSTTIIEISDVDPMNITGLVDQTLCNPGTVTLAPTVSGGVPTYTYIWSTGQTTPTISPIVLSSTTYTVTAFDECGNSFVEDVTIDIAPAPTAFVSGIVQMCPPAPPVGAMTVSFTGSAPWDITYAIDGVLQPPITGITDNPFLLPISQLGTYTIVEVTSAGCTGMGSGVAEVSLTTITPFLIGNDISCNGLSDGFINTIPTGGQSPYTYNWNSPLAGTEQSPNFLPAGTYTVTVTDLNGCTGTATTTINEPPPINLNAVGNTVDCNNANGGTIDLTVNGGTFPYAFYWSNGSMQEDPSGLAPGIYSVTVTDLSGCTVTTSATVNENFDYPNAVANAPNAISCTNSQVSLDGNGSSAGGNFTYNWTTIDGSITSGQNSLTPTVNSGGTYEIVVTNTSNGCIATASVTVGEDTTPPDAMINAPPPVNCTNPEITLNGNGSSAGPDIVYQWTTTTGNIVSGQNSLNPLINSGGNYTLTVTNNANGCTDQAFINVVENTIPPTADAGAPQTLDCNSTTITLNGSGSSLGPNYQYLWTTNDGSISSGATSIFPIVATSGTYQIQVTDIINGCTAIATVVVNQDNVVPVSDAGTANDLTCSTTQISLDGSSSSQGTGYSYQWTTSDGNIVNNGTSLNPTINAIGTYELTVTAPNGCTAISSVLVGENTTSPTANAGAVMTLDCNTTTISLDGSSSSSGGNFSYQWTTGNGNIISGDNTLSPTVDAAGEYTLTVTDTSNGCTATASTNVDNSADLPIADAGVSSTLTCIVLETTLDGSNSETGGNITYQWTTTDGNIISGDSTTNPIVNGVGTYQIEVTNTLNGCTSIATVQINEDVQDPVAVATAPTSLTCTETEVNLDGSGSSSGSNFTYEWTTTTGNIVSGENSLTPLVNAAGTYEILVTNQDNGCTQMASIAVAVDGDLPDADAGLADDLTCATTQLALNGSGSTGTNISYQWTTQDGNILSDANTLNPTINAVGTYQLEVTDLANGCTSVSTVLVNENMESPDVLADTPDLLTCAVNQVSLSANNSATGGDFSYAWSTQNGNILSGETTLNPTVDQAGNYDLEITNNTNGCTAVISVPVDIDNQPPNAEAGPTMMVNCDNPEITLDGSGSESGTNFTYEWTTSNGVIISGENSVNPLIGATGDYQILVTNLDNGCTSISDVFVGEDFDAPDAMAGTPQTLSCSETALSLNGNGSSFGNNFTYEWTTPNGNILSGETTLTPEINAPGNYDLLVTNTTNGCTSMATVNIDQDANVPIADAGSNDLLNCNITSVVLDGSGSSSGIGFTYEWTTPNGNIVNGENTLNPEINAPGDYQLEVTNNANGCTSLSALNIIMDDTPPAAEAGISQFLSCSNNSLTLDGAGSSNGVNYAYEWVTQNGNITSGVTSLTPEVNAVGTYELIVTALDNGCTASDIVEITQDASLPTADAGPGFEITCDVFEDNLDGSNSSINNDITFEWTTQDGNIVSGATTLTPLVDAAGVYQLTLTNSTNGCTAISSVTIIENNSPPSASAGTTMELNCYNEMLSLSGSTPDSSSTLVYEWTTQDGNILSGENTLNPEVDGAGIYELTITNTSTGCVSNDQVEITSNFASPTADAGATDELNCTQAFATLDGSASSTGANFIYQWNTSNGNIVFGDNTLNPDVNMPGDYELLVTNLANGCTAVQAVNITQNLNTPTADAGVANDLTCVETSFQLDGSNSSLGANFEYLWTSVDGNVLTGNTTLNPQINEPGTYQLQVTDQSNNCTAVAEVVVNENVDTPIADAGTQGLITCAITQTQLDGSNSSFGNNFTYQWLTSDGSIIGGDDSVNPTVGGTGIYELIVTNTINGCTANAFVDVTSNETLPDVQAIPNGILTCNETNIALNGNGSSIGSGYTYQWTTSNGNIISGDNTLLPTVNQIGDYTLTVFDANNGCSNQITITVEEDLTPPIAIVDQTGIQSLDCITSSVTLDGSGSQPQGNISYQWTTSNGNILSGFNTPNPEVDDDGIYTLTITNLTNGCTASESVTVLQDLSVPIADVNTPLVLTCDLTEINLDGGNSSQGNDYTYQWITSNGNIVSGGTTLNPLINQPGTYELIVTDLTSNCTNQTSIMVSENVTPPIAEAGVADILDCQTTFITLDGSQSSSGNNYTYQWSTATGNFITSTNNVAPSVDAAGNYTILVTNLQNGCTATDFVTVEEDENVPTGIIYEIDQPECHGDQGSILIETVDGGTPPYVYSIDGTNFYSGHIFTIQAGDYTLYAQDAEGCETQINFEIPELDPVTITLEEEVTIELGENYQIEATTSIPPNEIDSISWTPDHRLSCNNCLNPKVENLFESATYTLTIVNIYGCVTTATITINVDKSRAIYIPNIFTPNEDGNNDVFMIYAGKIDQIKTVHTLRIYDRWGEEVFRKDGFMPMDPDFGWDGKLRGQLMNPQVFVYWTEIEFIDGIKILYKGDVTLRK